MHINKIKIMYLGAFGKHCSDPHRVTGLKKCGLYDVVSVIDYRKFSLLHKNNFSEKISQLIGSTRPQVLLMNKAEIITPDDIKLWKKNYPKLFIAYWYGDMRGEIADYVKNKLSVVDIFLTNADDKKYYKKIISYGIKRNQIFFSHTATDTHIFKKHNEINEEYDIIFFGGNYSDKFPDSQTRLKYIKKLCKENNYKIKIFGIGWHGLGDAEKPIYNDDYARQASKAKIILGFSSFIDVHKYTSNRIWNSMACGFHLCYKFSGIDEFFEKEKHLDWFEDYNEMKNLIEYYLHHEEIRKKIFESGRQKINSKHTYVIRAVEMYSIFKKNIYRK